MKKPKRLWSADDLATMIRMREVERSRWSDIEKALDRGAGSVHAKYQSLRRDKLPSAHQNDAGGRPSISADQESERLARKQAAMRRDLTGEVFGDPPPGFSALDHRQSGVER